ncbi:hypothetical protein KIW84_024773 [Lathyrus oleraceus]|uniref:Uncharacterized protein n=1 Tax=Pisum sativum TaxID=3888 RepID=A0A9D4YMD3_PEA|nr:hypothetical protein KIW84_024773 [Pisum sativum]
MPNHPPASANGTYGANKINGHGGKTSIDVTAEHVPTSVMNKGSSITVENGHSSNNNHSNDAYQRVGFPHHLVSIPRKDPNSNGKCWYNWLVQRHGHYSKHNCGPTKIKPNHNGHYQSQKPIINRALPQKTNASRNSNVLIQNNQKQNGMISKGKSASKIDSNKPTTRGSSSESSTGIRKATNKSATNVNIPPKRSGSRVTDNRKEFPPSKTQSISQEKKYNNEGFHEARSPDHAKSDFESKSIKCNYTTDGSIDQNAFNMNESSDVISFTFTSPLRKSMPESLSSD